MSSINEKYFFMVQDMRAAKIAGHLALLSGFKQNNSIPELDRHGVPVSGIAPEKAAIIARVVFDEKEDVYNITPFGCLVDKGSLSCELFIDQQSRKLNDEGHAAFDNLSAALEASLTELTWNFVEPGVNISVPNSKYEIFIPETSPEQYFNL